MPPSSYASRGGLKLEAALDAFQLRPQDLRCADLGCNIGGFTDCLLQRGAAHVYAVDTAYGQLAWKLRQDPRVTVVERTNALHFDPASLQTFQPCDFVVIDLGWTKQDRAIPAALRWLREGASARIITLIKPHYEEEGEGERAKVQGGGEKKRKHVLSDEDAVATCHRVLEAMPALGVRVIAHIQSPIRGGGKRGREGNLEYLALLSRDAPAAFSG
ncbi:MAG: SAM-dependent methyltransferase [Phycisphaeraceae bacterium]